ncbi:MAG: hypothetical protein KGY48_13480, partial [Wenzhouxiangellaceae bacterium]|nr:hypothetical protein [Wenzhouxiangellaceae bacterium]
MEADLLGDWLMGSGTEKLARISGPDRSNIRMPAERPEPRRTGGWPHRALVWNLPLMAASLGQDCAAIPYRPVNS